MDIGIEIVLSPKSSSNLFFDASFWKRLNFLVVLWVAWEVPDETFDGGFEEEAIVVSAKRRRETRTKKEKRNVSWNLEKEDRRSRVLKLWERRRFFESKKERWIDFDLSKRDWNRLWEEQIQNLNLMKVWKIEGKKSEKILKFNERINQIFENWFCE